MIIVGRDTCRQLDAALDREWLITNGIGGYASGTVAGANTRRYHGLLVAALEPPRDRTLMLARVDEELVVEDRTFYLGTNEYHDGTVNPNGYIHLEECRIEDGIPTFTFNVPEVQLARTIWMENGQNTTYLRYTLGGESRPATLRVALFTTYRSFHHETMGTPDWVFGVVDDERGLEISAFQGARPLRVRASPSARFIQTGVWYWRFLHRRERDRGLDCLEDLYSPGLLIAPLQPGDSLTIQASAEDWGAMPSDFADALDRRRGRQRKLWALMPLAAQSPQIRDLVVAADQFVITARPRSDGVDRPTTGIVAGYHWFGEWGRDALIALPGLLLETGRYVEARDLLRRYAGFVDHGMLPNRIPDEEQTPEYNTIDATLWLFQALDRYLRATRDDDLLAELYPTLQDVFKWHREETRYGIQVDEDDGLLGGGVPGVQLTWMDAKVGDWVVTPRRGKPVEVNALWYNAVRMLDDWSRHLGKPTSRYREAAAQVYESFNERFWYAEGGYLYDVVDGEAGNDASPRPNQILAIGLSYPTLDPRRWESVLQIVDRLLLTPVGLRSLAPDASGYRGHYGGDQANRDGAYHQGTVWPWLLGPYADACKRAGRDLTVLKTVLGELIRTSNDIGLGTIGEIFDGDPPYTPAGTIAQAWSVGEILRAWRRIAQE
ncbi:MAG: amylo-alpha-1,6-glucosidase [Chloroflexota bacterium]